MNNWQIQTVYNVGDTVYFMKDNRIHSGVIVDIRFSYSVSSSGKGSLMGLHYGTDAGFLMFENEIFPDRESLIKTL